MHASVLGGQRSERYRKVIIVKILTMSSSYEKT